MSPLHLFQFASLLYLLLGYSKSALCRGTLRASRQDRLLAQALTLPLVLMCVSTPLSFFFSLTLILAPSRCLIGAVTKEDYPDAIR